MYSKKRLHNINLVFILVTDVFPLYAFYFAYRKSKLKHRKRKKIIILVNPG